MLAIYRAQKLSDYVKQIISSSVTIESYMNNNTGDIGGGFFVAPRVVATCAHVVGLGKNQNARLKSIVVTTENNQKFYGTVVDYNSDLDIALIYINATAETQNYFLNLGNSGTIKEGEAIVSIGSPLGFHNAVSYGVISRKNINGNKNFFLMDVRTNPGNSGGLIYSLDKQAVIGICSAVYTAQNVPSDSISMGIGIDQIKNLLSKNKIKFVYREE